MNIRRRSLRGLGVAVALTGCAFADEPAPSPTPKPGTLAAFAAANDLDRSRIADGDSVIVITAANLEELGEGAVLSVTTEPAAPPPELGPVEPVDPAVRTRWRNAVLAQSRTIARLESRRERVEGEIDSLERGRLDARTLDRIEKAEAKLAAVEAEIRRERAVLSRIVRDARKDGAQPGWFR